MSRLMAFGIWLTAILQLAAPIAVEFAEARNKTPDERAHVERRHSDDCVVLHRPSACLLCQHAAARSHAGRPSSLPAIAAIIGFNNEPAVAGLVSRPLLFEPPSRGPPALLG